MTQASRYHARIFCSWVQIAVVSEQQPYIPSSNQQSSTNSIQKHISLGSLIEWHEAIPSIASTNFYPGTFSRDRLQLPDDRRYRAAGRADGVGLANNFLNNRSLSARPASVNTTDFVLPTGS
jgi:hypothetical protein